jgi:hypothetical protein
VKAIMPKSTYAFLYDETNGNGIDFAIITMMTTRNDENPNMYNNTLNRLNHLPGSVQGIGPRAHMAKLAIIREIKIARSVEINGMLLFVIAASNSIRANTPITLGLIILNTSFI